MKEQAFAIHLSPTTTVRVTKRPGMDGGRGGWIDIELSDIDFQRTTITLYCTNATQREALWKNLGQGGQAPPPVSPLYAEASEMLQALGACNTEKGCALVARLSEKILATETSGG